MSNFSKDSALPTRGRSLKREHFTIKEAERKDDIVAGYFGRSGINRIAETLVDFLLAPPRLQANAKVLDVGAGLGFFTAKIADKISC